MENVLLIIHLIIALILIGAVLLQRSEGGGLGVGGGNSNFMSNRSASTALNKLTWIIAIMFLVTSLILTILAANEASRQSVLDTNNINEVEADDTPLLPDLKQLKALPKEDTPSTPPKEY